MYYYIFILFLITGTFFITRLNAGYHANLILKKYIEIKNPVFQVLLVPRTNPETFKSGTSPEHGNKLLYLGAVFYLIWFSLVIFTLIMWLVVPDIPTVPFMLDDYLGEYYISTINQILPAKLWLTCGLFDISFWAINITKCNGDVNKNNLIRTIWIATVAVLFAVSLLSLGFIFIN